MSFLAVGYDDDNEGSQTGSALDEKLTESVRRRRRSCLE